MCMHNMHSTNVVEYELVLWPGSHPSSDRSCHFIRYHPIIDGLLEAARQPATIRGRGHVLGWPTGRPQEGTGG